VQFGGVLVSYGMTVAPKISVPMSLVLKNIDVRGSTMGSRKEFQDMVKFVGEHKIKPVISRVVEGGLENSEGIESLFDDMKNGRQFGKLVISLDGGAAKGSKL
jgi:D-arabinose 1-dehydrogenase-like Zn-dependent alcohol dehydrogenase